MSSQQSSSSQGRKLRFLAKNNKIKVAVLVSTVFVTTAISLYKLNKGKYYVMILILSIVWGMVADLFEWFLGWCGNKFVVKVFFNIMWMD